MMKSLSHRTIDGWLYWIHRILTAEHSGLRISITKEPIVLPGTLSNETLIFLKKQVGKGLGKYECACEILTFSKQAMLRVTNSNN